MAVPAPSSGSGKGIIHPQYTPWNPPSMGLQAMNGMSVNAMPMQQPGGMQGQQYYPMQQGGWQQPGGYGGNSNWSPQQMPQQGMMPQMPPMQFGGGFQGGAPSPGSMYTGFQRNGM